MGYTRNIQKNSYTFYGTFYGVENFNIDQNRNMKSLNIKKMLIKAAKKICVLMFL